MHRELTGAQSGVDVDHINGNKLDNRRANLRLVTRSQNMRNIHSSRNQKKGGHKGVGWSNSHNKWRAFIRAPSEDGHAGRYVHLGCYDDRGEAARRYDSAAAHYYGEFCCLNFPEETPAFFDISTIFSRSNKG